VGAAQDVSAGGLAVALAEMAIWGGRGASVRLPIGDSPAVELFGEGPSRIVCEVEPRDVPAFVLLAREHGLTPTRMALAFCFGNWRVASTILGVTSVAQLDENVDAFGTTLSPELLAAIDAVRWEIRDPAQ